MARVLLPGLLLVAAAAAGVHAGWEETASAQFSFDISVSKGDSPDPVYAGSSLTYSISVTFFGDANSVSIQDPLPPGVAFLGDACQLQGVPGTGHGQYSGGVWSFNAQGLILGSLVCQISVQVSTDVVDGTALANTASVTATGFSTVSKSASTETMVLNPPPGPPAVGGITGVIGGDSGADGPHAGQAGDVADLSLVALAAAGAAVVIAVAAGATYAVRSVRRED